MKDEENLCKYRIFTINTEKRYIYIRQQEQKLRYKNQLAAENCNPNENIVRTNSFMKPKSEF